MKAIRYYRYGGPDVVRLEEVPPPEAGAGDVLVRVRAASVNPYDWHFMRGEPLLLMRAMFGLRAPKDPRLGVDLAGVVEAVGADVTALAPGDEVMGRSTGTFAELIIATEDQLVGKPENVTFQQAASAPAAGYTALQALRDHGRIEPGHKVLVIGASGGVGTFAVQIARSFGADVTAVASARNLDMLATIGAKHVIDYTTEDVTTLGVRYDVVLDTIGSHSLSACRRLVAPGGSYLMVGGPRGRWFRPADRMIRLRLVSLLGGTRMVSFHARPSQADLRVLAELLEQGDVVPVVDREYGLGGVPDAIRYVEQGHARGKVVITV